jgi:hypothetical protein
LSTWASVETPVLGSYGAFYDIMKLNVAISSFGGQYWQQCFYAMDTANITSITPAFNSAGRDCVSTPGSASAAAGPATFAGGSTPVGLTFLENQNYRLFPTTCSTCALTQEGVAPGLKPYRQHESVFGVDYQLAKNLAFEARWDRRRLDHVIEDSSIFNDTNGSETFVIVNPGQGVNRTFLVSAISFTVLKPNKPAPHRAAPIHRTTPSRELAATTVWNFA